MGDAGDVARNTRGTGRSWSIEWLRTSSGALRKGRAHLVETRSAGRCQPASVQWTSCAAKGHLLDLLVSSAFVHVPILRGGLPRCPQPGTDLVVNVQFRVKLQMMREASGCWLDNLLPAW